AERRREQANRLLTQEAAEYVTVFSKSRTKLECMATRTLLTIDDFERLPDNVVKNKELVDGELVDVSGNTPRHNLVREYLIAVLYPQVRQRGLGMVIAEQRSEEHTSELQSRGHLVCRLLLEKKK